MDDSDRRFIKTLFILATAIGVILTLFWGSDDKVGESDSVLGRSHDEVKNAPQGADQNLSPTIQYKKAAKKDSHEKNK